MNTAELYDTFVLKNYARAPLTLVRGAGTEVWDDTGKRYLDFTSGIAVNTLGHCHPRWAEAVASQARNLVHVSNLFRHPLQAELAQRLVDLAAPGRIFLCNSGAEANEALIKLARLHGLAKAGGAEGKCFRVLCARQAFHGRTFGGMSATPQPKVQNGFSPLVPGFAFGDLNDLASFERIVDDSVAAVLVETIQGEGGIHACTAPFLQGLRALCDRHRLLLMLDEVQCGAGRTGRFFAFEELGVRPDAIGMAKGLGGGFPIGAIWVVEGAADLFKPGSHGSTFGGAPLACAAALAVLDVMQSDGLLARVRERTPAWRASLEALAGDFPDRLTGVRGKGYLVGLQLAGEAQPFLAALRQQGLLAAAAGPSVVRLLPPLTVSAEELATSVRMVRAVLSASS